MEPRVPESLDALIEKGRHIVIYGGPGTGKTRLALHLLARAVAKGLSVELLFSEAGTLPLASRMGLSLPVSPIYAIDDLARKVTEASLRGSFTVIDTVNSFYIEGNAFNTSLLAYVGSLLKETGGVSVVLARAMGKEPASLKPLLPFSDAVIETSKTSIGEFQALVHWKDRDDVSVTLRFRPRGWHVEWI